MYTKYDKAIAAAIASILAALLYTYLPAIIQTIEVHTLLTIGMTAFIVWAVPNKPVKANKDA